MTIERVKAILFAIGGAITAWLGVLATPVYILTLLMIIDYFTGITAAPCRGEVRNSNKGFKGIAKKICILLLVAVAAIVDWAVIYAAEVIGFANLPFNFVVSCLAAVWLICNEIISILENIGDIGVNAPPFIMKAVKWVKEQTEKKGEDEKNG